VSAGLPVETRAWLLRLARASVEQAVRDDGTLDAFLAAGDPPRAAREPRGVFVSLKTVGADGRLALRGCIGSVRASAPLHRTVAEMATGAALHDPRFPPVTPGEIEALRIEVSVLDEPTPVDDPASLVPGRDGVELVRGAAHSVFLPQVAREQGWSVDQLLRQLARKAGLAEDGWRDAKLSVFRSEVLSESDDRN
jgi:AmmeMemoRadiSam system protein A